MEFIVIHIPKTAGRSFRKILQEIYGLDHVFCVKKKVFRAHTNITPKIPSKTKVLQGHFTFSDISKLYRNPNVPILTWVRDPVERVISNYCFFMKRIQNGMAGKNSHRLNESILEYARREGSRNRMSKFLDGLPLKDLYFVGIVEYFEQDLTRLADLLEWGNVAPVHMNSGKCYKKMLGPFSENVRKEIRRLNDRDVALYREATRLRDLKLTALKQS